MTIKELELLKLENTPLNLNVDDQLVTWDFKGETKDERDYCARIGRARYFDFAEAQALLNDLENHIQ